MTADLFMAAVKRLTEKQLTLAELVDTAEKLRAAGQADQALQLYTIWVNFNPTDPLVYVVQFNRAAMLSDAGELVAARAALEAAQAVNPEFLPAYVNLGGVLERLGSVDQAVNQWLTVINKLAPLTGQAITYKTAAYKQIGRVLEARHHDADAETMLRQSLELDPEQPEVIQHYLSLRMNQCSWPVAQPVERVSRQHLMRHMSPLSLSAYSDDPLLQLATAAFYCKGLGEPRLLVEQPKKAKDRKRLRIGYVSSDLREHAVGFLMAEMFGLHDRAKVEVFAYYCGVPAQDATNARIRESVDCWVDITGMDDEAAARRIAADGIDILVDVNGYTRDARTKIFAMRPAPVIVNWLGYPGTMASPYHHYIIADDWIIPPELEMFYSEKVVRLPCYQPNDRKRVVWDGKPTRTDAGLPEDGVVFCCFNGLHKITRFTFERWMEILKRVPGSVLWLLASEKSTCDRLGDLAEKHGIDRNRLVFGAKLANAHHLARYPLADLCLDTLPYGAHTTASDCLWMGVPVLTLSGRGFASRVCGSLARAAGLPELVCQTPRDFVELAVELGNDRARLQQLKDKLKANRDTCTLFDMEKLVRGLEGLYAGMWKDYASGRLPRPDLRNLEVYQDIGIAEDHEAHEMLAVEDYQGWYRQRLARRHLFRPIPADQRLWTEAEIKAAEG